MSMRLSVDLPRVTNINFLLTITGTKKYLRKGKLNEKKFMHVNIHSMA